MVTTVKFSDFATANLNTSTNTLVGLSTPGGGINVKTPKTPSWTTGARPATPYAGLQGYNTTANKIEYWNGSAWIQLP